MIIISEDHLKHYFKWTQDQFVTCDLTASTQVKCIQEEAALISRLVKEQVTPAFAIHRNPAEVFQLPAEVFSCQMSTSRKITQMEVQARLRFI